MRKIGFLLLLVSVCSYADIEVRRMFNVEEKAVFLNAGGTGWLTGLSYENYIPLLPISYGIAGYFGTPTGGNISNENMTMIGVPLRVDGHLTSRLVYGLGVFGGYTQASLANSGTKSTFTGFILEETVSLGFVLGDGWRISLDPGYLQCFKNNSFTGMTVGLRLERKTLQNIKPRDD